jgi:hypothetical protein
LFSSPSKSGRVSGNYVLAFGISFPGSDDALSDQTEYYNHTIS